MNTLRISIIQTDIVWENKQENLRLLREKLQSLSGKTEIVVLPEMFSTGFSMRSAQLAEPVDGDTISTLRRWAAEFDVAICGSYIAREAENHFNRAFFLTPQGEERYYDKRHLFRMAGEDRHFQPGNETVVVGYLGWNIFLSVCYDLRFPVWLRNTNNRYDVMICVANWPSGRRAAWDTLLQARALENQCYVCGVNRIGTDAFEVDYDGGSVIVSPQGKIVASVPDNEEGTDTATLDLQHLRIFRERFPAWKDADEFFLKDTP